MLTKEQIPFFEVPQFAVRDSYHTTEIANAQALTDHAHKEQMAVVLQECVDLMTAKGGDYNNLSTFCEQMVFGDYSWVTLIWVKAKRIASVVYRKDSTFDALDDVIRDLINYSVAYLAWRRLQQQENNQ